MEGDSEFKDIVYFKYTPVWSIDVEQSFSMYKAVLADNFENLHLQIIIQYIVTLYWKKKAMNVTMKVKFSSHITNTVVKAY